MAGEGQGKPSNDRRKGAKARDKSQTAGKQPSSEEQPEEPQEKAEQEPTHGRAPCPIVGVGASAGGLEALQGLFAHVPADLNAAFVVVQHRAADRTSVMKSLIEKHTQLGVIDIEDTMKIKPGTIYLGPAERDVSILNGEFLLVAPPPHVGVHLPIDSFLRSLAAGEGDRTICIILSGTSSDGTLGLKEVKAAGGLVMAQEETQAKYDSMPRNAIDTGMVDFVLPVEKMGEQLAQYLRHPFLARRRPPDMEKNIETRLQKIFVLIRSQTGHDFSHYKRNTIQRRIARRLAVHQIENLDHYVRFCQENPEEVKTLAREMLITVTNFFRDREAFEALQEKVIVPLVQQKAPDSFVRIWVAGCATGEEAYSVAIQLYEAIARSEKHLTVQIFATDIDEESVETGRHGQYPKSIAGDISPERLKRFFAEENNHYKVRSVIREMIVFAKHNLIKDAPFSRLDLVCCRNVLIYMDGILQKKLIPMFHYTLNPGSTLFLGESESVGTFSDLFVPLDTRHKIFKRKPVTTGYKPDTEIGFYPPVEPARKGKGKEKKERQDIGTMAERVILRDYSVPCAIVGEDYNVVYFNGDVNKFLIQPSGRPTMNILQMARPDIHYRLNLLLKRAFHERHIAMEKDVQVRVNDHYLNIDIVTSLRHDGLCDDIRIVVEKLTRIEKEVVSEKGDIYQMRIVPYRTAENVIEGAVVTFVDISEYKKAQTVLERAGDFAQAIVETVRHPLLILDTECKIVSANPAFYRHFRVSPEETTGRFIYDLGDRQWDIPALRELIEKIVPENEKFEGYKVSYEFPQIGRRTFLLNARQTTLRGEATERVLLAFEDVTGQEEGQ